MAKPVKHYGGWRIRWIDGDTKRRSEVHPTYREAETALRRHQLEAEEVKRGLRSPTPPDKSFSELCDHYLAFFSSQKRRRRDDESIIRAHLRPYFGAMKLRDIADHVEPFKVSRAHLNKKTLHNQLTLLISMLNVAHEKNWLHKVPRIRKPRIRLFDRDFTYLRTEDEIARFLRAAHDEGEQTYYLYATAVYTGMREGELAGLRWEDINLERRLIAVQRSYDGPTKAGDVRYIPILDPLLPLLKEWRLKCPYKHVFPSEAGTMHKDSARIFQEALHRTLDRASFPRIEKAGRIRRYIVFHDLRHTFASHWMMKGGDLFKLQKILGHKDPQMTMRYAHLAPSAFVSDYDRLTDLTVARTSPLVRLHQVWP